MEVSTSPAAPAPLGPGNSNGTASPSFPAAASDRLISHLSTVIQITLGATETDLEAVGCLLHPAQRRDTIDRCLRFANDTQSVLYVQKDILPKDAAVSPAVGEELEDRDETSG